jgi:hypothetical protein
VGIIPDPASLKIWQLDLAFDDLFKQFSEAGLGRIECGHSVYACLNAVFSIVLTNVAVGSTEQVLILMEPVLEERLAKSHLHFSFAGGQIRSFMSLISYFGAGENRERYLGLKIPPSLLKPDFLEQAQAFANELADGLVAVSEPSASARARS